MKVLITGGCGFLGSNLAFYFLKKDYEVFIIDSLERKGSINNLEWLKSNSLKNQLTFAKYDISKQEELNIFFEKFAPFEFICHVAGQVAMTLSIENPRKDMETNVIGTFNVLEAMRKYSPNALLAYSSTNKVYGDLNWIKVTENEKRYVLNDFPLGLDENIPLDFSTPYGCSKGSADQYVKDWARLFDLKTVIFRHSSIYGGRQFASIDQGWIGWFCLKALEQKSAFNNIQVKPFTISGTGKQVRDVLHSDDLVSLYQCAFEKKDILKGEIFNIGGGKENSLSILELIDILRDELSFKELNFKKIARRNSDQDCFIANIGKAKEILEWEPKLSHRQGIKKMLEWTKNMPNS